MRLTELGVGAAVAHIEDIGGAFDGVVTEIDTEPPETLYCVRWGDGETDAYRRSELVAREDQG